MYASNDLPQGIDQQQAIAHLSSLGYKRGDKVYIRYIHSVTKKSIKASKLDFAEANRYQAQGYDTYFVVNGGGDTDKAITKCRVIFYEHDDLDKSIQLLLWQTLGLPEPTIQIDTGGKSIHSYWLLTEDISPDQWRQLQADLLEYSDGDRTLKNPSRIMRLAGSWYMKGDNPGSTAAVIVSNSGQRYTYDSLRAAIPQATQKQPALLQQGSTIREPDIVNLIGEYIPLKQCGFYWKGDCPFCNAVDQFIVKPQHQTFECLVCKAGGDADNYCGSAAEFLKKYCAFSGTSQRIRYKDITVPVPESVPLEVCLSKDSRQLLQSGVGKGGRNDSGAKLARDLIGTANYLQDIGQRFNGDPWQLFLDYCNRCPDGHGWNELEWRSIWKSAESDRPTPSCKEDGVQNCIKAWYWNTCLKPSQQNHGIKSNNQFDKNNSGGGSGNPTVSSVSLRDRVLEILGRSNLERSDRKAAFIELAKSTGVQLREVEQLAEAIESDFDFDAEAVEAKVNLPDLLRNHNQELNPADYLWGDGGWLAAAINFTAEAMPTAAAMIFCTFIAASASRIGTSSRIVIKASAKYVQTCIFWIAVVSRSGTLKTPAQKIAIDPLVDLEVEAKKAHDRAMENYEEEQKNWKEGDPFPKKPDPRKRYLTKDSTLETLERIHNDNPRGLLYYRDELAGMSKSQNAFKPSGKGADQEAELDQWNGSPMIVDRKEREICLDKTAISRTGSIQYDVMQKLAGDHEDSNGNLARWLLCAVKAPPRFLTFYDMPDTGISTLLETLYRNLEKLPVRDYLIDKDSQAIFKQWQNQLVAEELAENHPGLQLVYPKIEAYTARLALWLHCVNAILAGELPAPSIPGVTMLKAVELASFFLGQAKLVYAVNSPQSGLTGRLLKLYQYADGKSQGITPRQVKRNSRALGGVATAEILRECQTLVKEGFFRLEGEAFFVVGTLSAVVGSCRQDVGKVPTTGMEVNQPSQEFVGSVGSVGRFKNNSPTPTENSVTNSATTVGVTQSSKEGVGIVDNADTRRETPVNTGVDAKGGIVGIVPTTADNADNCLQPVVPIAGTQVESSSELTAPDQFSDDVGDEWITPKEDRFEEAVQKALDAERAIAPTPAPEVFDRDAAVTAPNTAGQNQVAIAPDQHQSPLTDGEPSAVVAALGQGQGSASVATPEAALPKFKIGDTVALADPYTVAYAFHGVVEDLDGENALIRWAERRGKPNDSEIYKFSDLRLLGS